MVHSPVFSFFSFVSSDIDFLLGLWSSFERAKQEQEADDHCRVEEKKERRHVSLEQFLATIQLATHTTSTNNS
jgi:hypothetical protein